MSDLADAADDSRPSATGLRGGLRRLSAFLLVYGVIGLLIALLGLGAIVWASGRVGALADRVETEVAMLADRVDATAQALDDAGATAASFATTLERTPPTVEQAAATVANVRASLVDIEGRLTSLTVLGTTPLASVAGRFGQIATDLEGLDQRLGTLATDLGTNRERLVANAASLDALAGRLTEQAEVLRSGIVGESIDDIGAIIMVMLVLFTIWTAVPAVGAIGLGIWLRREVEPD